jgi:hypothetical protein
MKEETCKHCIISHASGFGWAAKNGVPTCKLHYPNRILPDDLRGTYERCEDVIMMKKCKYEKNDEQ